MKQTIFKAAMLSLSCLSAACCLAAEAPASRAQSRPAVLDVALDRGGLLQGQVIDAQGAAMQQAPVSVWFENRQVATSLTNEHGQFSVTGLRGGVHTVSAGKGGAVYRLWTSEAAPPGARSGTVVIPGETVMRGQNGQPIRSIVYSPILWGAAGYTAGHIIGFNSGIDRTPSSP